MITKKKPIEIQEWENEGGACKPTQISLPQITVVQRAGSSLRKVLDRATFWIAESPITYLIIMALFGVTCAILGSQCHKL